MVPGILTTNSNTINDKAVKYAYRANSIIQNSRLSKLFDDLSERAREDFFSYLEQLGLSADTDLLVIPSTRHFFYEADDLKGVRTVVNLKHLNHVREMKEFLRTISELLPFNSNFVGCFVDNRTQNGFSDEYSNLPGHFSDKAEAYENGIESRIPFINRMYSFIDSRTNRYLTRRSVTALLEEYGLKVIGMTELNGLTYFYTQKIRPAA